MHNVMLTLINILMRCYIIYSEMARNDNIYYTGNTLWLNKYKYKRENLYYVWTHFQ